MPSVTRLVQLAAKYGPVAAAAGKKAYGTVEPQVRAYLLAQKVDGHLVDWPSSHGTIVFVLDARGKRVVDGFPQDDPRLHREVLAGDPAQRIHHRDHWLAGVLERARTAGTYVAQLPGQLRRDDDGDDLGGPRP